MIFAGVHGLRVVVWRRCGARVACYWSFGHRSILAAFTASPAAPYFVLEDNIAGCEWCRRDISVRPRKSPNHGCRDPWACCWDLWDLCRPKNSRLDSGGVGMRLSPNYDNR